MATLKKLKTCYCNGVLSDIVPGIMDTVERVAAYAPPFVYSKVTGIKSPTGVEAEGWLIALGETPEQMQSHSPEFTTGRILEAAKTAKRLGAQIMGIGMLPKAMKDIGLPPQTAYAGLAETIVLALEGRFESFTAGSDTEWEKVSEIYRKGLKHGMKLAAISGVDGVFSDDDIFKVKELALKEIKKAKKNPL